MNRFSTARYSAEHAFEPWRSVYGGLHEVAVPRSEMPGFRADAVQWHDGGTTIGCYRTPTRRVERTKRHLARDDRDHWVFRVARSGRFNSITSSGLRTGQAGQLIISTFACGYVEHYTDGSWIAAMVPRSAWPELAGGLEMAARMPAGTPGTMALAQFLLGCHDSLTEERPLQPGLQDLLGNAVAEMLHQQRHHVAKGGMPKQIIRDLVERTIRVNIHSARLDAARLASLTGLSRSKLYRLFDGEDGVAGYIRRLRLHLVLEALEDASLGHESISSIASRFGFHNVSAFNRTFRQALDRTPSEVREIGLRRASGLTQNSFHPSAAANGCFASEEPVGEPPWLWLGESVEPARRDIIHAVADRRKAAAGHRRRPEEPAEACFAGSDRPSQW